MNKTVAILFGGNSDEHIASIKPAQYVCELLIENNCKVDIFYFDYANQIYKITHDKILDDKVIDIGTALNLSDFLNSECSLKRSFCPRISLI